MGPPRTQICDQGREFVSREFEEFCASQARLVLRGPTVRRSTRVVGLKGTTDALADITEDGVLPLQAVAGRVFKVMFWETSRSLWLNTP